MLQETQTVPARDDDSSSLTMGMQIVRAASGLELNTPRPECNAEKVLIDVPEPTPKEELEGKLREGIKPITLKELEETLNTTIKYDTKNKLITFLSMLLNYTEEDQVNLGFNAESSTGKSYIPLELAQYFPQEDILYVGYSSPTAFFHGFKVSRRNLS